MFDSYTDGLEVALWNFQTGIRSDIATLSAVDFVLSGGQAGGSIAQRSGIVRNIGSGGTEVTDASGGTAAFTCGWAVESSFWYARGLELTALTGGPPSLTIIGPADAHNRYPGANKSITGNHNPFLATPDAGTPVRFTLSVPGVTPETTVTGVKFSFGTDNTAVYDGMLVSTPEPGTWLLGASGLAGALLCRLRRRNRRPQLIRATARAVAGS